MAEKRALYWGCWETIEHHPDKGTYWAPRLGHYLHNPNGSTQYHPRQAIPGFPWSDALLDGGLLKNGQEPDRCTGRVRWTLGGTPLWHAFYWWDRSVDHRGASNSGFYVCGFDAVLEHYTTEAMQRQRDEAFEFAKSQFPRVVARQPHPLVIVEDGFARPQTDAQWQHL